jgi:hypothetical protein
MKALFIAFAILLSFSEPLLAEVLICRNAQSPVHKFWHSVLGRERHEIVRKVMSDPKTRENVIRRFKENHFHYGNDKYKPMVAILSDIKEGRHMAVEFLSAPDYYGHLTVGQGYEVKEVTLPDGSPGVSIQVAANSWLMENYARLAIKEVYGVVKKGTIFRRFEGPGSLKRQLHYLHRHYPVVFVATFKKLLLEDKLPANAQITDIDTRYNFSNWDTPIYLDYRVHGLNLWPKEKKEKGKIQVSSEDYYAAIDEFSYNETRHYDVVQFHGQDGSKWTTQRIDREDEHRMQLVHAKNAVRDFITREDDPIWEKLVTRVREAVGI